MKTLEQYMALPYPLEIIPDSDEGGFVGSYPDLPGCLTCGETMEDVVRNAEDAKRAWLTAALEEGLLSMSRICQPLTLVNSSSAFPNRCTVLWQSTLAVKELA